MPRPVHELSGVTWTGLDVECTHYRLRPSLLKPILTMKAR